MPIYEYACESCGHNLEKLQKISDPKLTHCPECDKDTLKRLISKSSFQLKGKGWYVTDFKDKGSSGSTTKQESSASTTNTSSSDAA